MKLKDRGASPHPWPSPYRRGVLPCFSLLFLFIFSTFAAAQPAYPPLANRVTDAANIIAPDARQRIEAKLNAHEAKTTDQLVVATVPSLQGVTVEDFANGLFRFWRLGDKAKNNGVLLLVAPTERKVRIEVGYGLEGALTDALSKVIITTAIAPKFKTGDFAGGVEAGVDAILTILTGDAEEWQRRAVVREDAMSTADILMLLLFVAIVVAIIAAAFRSGPTGARQHRTRDGRWITLPASTSSGWSTGSSGGGWSSGSSSGGFSGGGGSSGGGGASGDW